MMEADKRTSSAADPRDVGTQLRPGLWHTINERYPGSMRASPARGTARTKVCQLFCPTRSGYHAVPCGQRRLGDVPPQSVSASRNQPDLRHENPPFSFLDRLWTPRLGQLASRQSIL